MSKCSSTGFLRARSQKSFDDMEEWLLAMYVWTKIDSGITFLLLVIGISERGLECCHCAAYGAQHGTLWQCIAVLGIHLAQDMLDTTYLIISLFDTLMPWHNFRTASHGAFPARRYACPRPSSPPWKLCPRPRHRRCGSSHACVDCACRRRPHEQRRYRHLLPLCG